MQPKSSMARMAYHDIRPPKRLIVGISGATGIAYGIELLKTLRVLGVESHLVVTKAGEQTRVYETSLSSLQLRELADVTYSIGDVSASISSGSFQTMGMVVAPCSMRTLSEIACGASSSLLTRAADVTLKERRPLVLLARESPLSLIHLRNMVAATEAGAIIMPPSVAFYAKPESLAQAVGYQVARLLDQFQLSAPGVRRWGDQCAAPEHDLVESA